MTADVIARVMEYLRAQLSGRVRDLRLSARGDVLVLRGRASSYYAKQLAQELVRRVTDVLLFNEIDVFELSDPWGFADRRIKVDQPLKRR